MTADALILLGVIGVTAAFATWWRWRDGRFRLTSDRLTRRELSALGAPSGVPVLLQFTAPGCRPCDTSWRLLEQVASQRPGVRAHAIDVADAPDVARTHGVLRAPTVFVIARDGSVLARTSGVPSAADLERLIDIDLARVA